MKKYESQLYIACVLLSLPLVFAGSNSCDSLSYRTGVRVRCEHPITGESINCRGEKVPIGAVARYKCEDYYVTLDGDSVGGNMTCSAQGKWTPEHPFRAFTCNMDCGRQLGDNKWPWHAVIFKREHASAPFKFACGGTLIDPFNKGISVITAAKCLKPHFALKSELDLKNIVVAVGLVSADFQKSQASGEVDMYPVASVATNGPGEIALLKLGKHLTLKENVLPVCFNGNPDLTNEQVKDGSLGEFVGFGKPINTTGQFDVLRGVSLPVLPARHCTQYKYPTDKPSICAGRPEGDNICRGDNGGSLSFSTFSGHSKRKFIQGVFTRIISESRLAICDSYGEFTRLVDYREWIRDTANEFNMENVPLASSPSPEEFEIAFQRETPKPILELAPTARPNYPDSPGSKILAPTSRPNYPDSPGSKIHVPISRPNYPDSPSKIHAPTSRPNYPDSPGSNIHAPTSRPNYPDTQSTNPGHHSPKYTSRPLLEPQRRTTTERYPDIPSTPNKGVPSDFAPASLNPRDYELAGLEWHNRIRNKHGAPPLVLSSTLNQEAQKEADESPRLHKFYSTTGFANWFALNGANLTPADAAKEAVRDWYKTNVNFDRNKPISSPFTTLVWKSATELGIGYAQNGDNQVVVAKYKIPNLIDIHTKISFLENVILAMPNH